MGFDLRQVVAGILTLTMFVMLGNMIKREHLDSLRANQDQDDVFEDSQLIEQDAVVRLSNRNQQEPWIQDSQDLKPCWSKTSLDEVEQSTGFVTFSLTNGPEYHVSQIADAVVVARSLGATLVVPDIRGTKAGDRWSFEDIYDADKFVNSLDGVVKVAKELPSHISMRNLAVVKVPNRVTETHIVENVEPVFREKGNIRLTTYFPTVNMRKTALKSATESVACLAMFGTLELQPEVSEAVDSMIDRLRTLGRKSDGKFVAVDLRVEILEENKNCHGSGTAGTKSCYNAQEIALFLRKVGFNKDTTIYVTQSRWDDSLDVLKDIFPKTYTKESIMPVEKRARFLESENTEIEKIVDFYMCSRSDVFVPAISGLFYANVAGKRIASGKEQIIVPAEISATSALIDNYISPYVAKKNHLAYSCFC